jgi:hypothetical protein
MTAATLAILALISSILSLAAGQTTMPDEPTTDPNATPVVDPAPLDPTPEPVAAKTIGDMIAAMEEAAAAQVSASSAAQTANQALVTANSTLAAVTASLVEGLRVVAGKEAVYTQAADGSVTLYQHDPSVGFVKSTPLPATTPLPTAAS